MIRHFVRTQLLAVALVAAVMLLGPIGASSAQTSGGAQYGGNLGQTAHGGTGRKRRDDPAVHRARPRRGGGHRDRPDRRGHRAAGPCQAGANAVSMRVV